MIAAQSWASGLAAWKIPDEILAAAPQSPWIHPVALFVAADAPAPDSPSHAKAREALTPGSTLLDVGCGGGRAAFAVAPPAGIVIGVDHQQGMLDAFAAAADRRRLSHHEVLGDWPDVADRTPDADVVVCHHVAYNVADLGAFAATLEAHARRRVVLELPHRHPLAGMAPLWRHFWNLDRPDGPRGPRRHPGTRLRRTAPGMGRGPRRRRTATGAAAPTGGVHAHPPLPDPGPRRRGRRDAGQVARESAPVGHHLVGHRPLSRTVALPGVGQAETGAGRKPLMSM